MTRTDLWKALEETQLYISKYYATALMDEDKHDQLKAYIEKFVLDSGYLVTASPMKNWSTVSTPKWSNIRF